MYGYFFKEQGYYPGKAKPDGPRKGAPLIVGKIDWHPTIVTLNGPEARLSYIALGVGGAIVLGVVVSWVFKAQQKKSIAHSQRGPVGAFCRARRRTELGRGPRC